MDSFTTEPLVIAAPAPEDQVPTNYENGGSSSATNSLRVNQVGWHLPSFPDGHPELFPPVFYPYSF
ncbi:hypothetical protein BC629DRAFT_1593019 [Irpex lacteus]|nr:hypothetical protein BC629DRAFT_1593019 [Irpex lacteus]